MEKFSYALEFYRQNIFSLDDVDNFKLRVEEAEFIDSYFKDIIPNLDYLRPYVLLSYRFNKEINDYDRINYIKGLIYANDYVDFEDFKNILDDYGDTEINFEDTIDNIKELYDENDLRKTSTWKFTGYSVLSNNPKYLLYEIDDYEEYKESNSNVVNNLIIDKGKNIDNKTTTLVKDVEDEIKEEINATKNASELLNYEIEPTLSVEQKVELFKKHKDRYIDSYIKYNLKQMLLSKEDVYMVKLAMNDWLDFIFTSMEDLIYIRNESLRYKDENIAKYI